MESTFEEDDNPMSLVPAGFEPEPEKGSSSSRANPAAAASMEDDDQEEEDFAPEDDEDSDVTAAKRGRELTDKYLAGN